jgi:hypothetical protein
VEAGEESNPHTYTTEPNAYTDSGYPNINFYSPIPDGGIR